MKNIASAKQAKHIPVAIADYIKAHFGENPVVQITRIKKNNGHCFYKAEVTYDNDMYYLKFNEKGKLLTREIEPAFPSDSYDSRYDTEAYDEKDF